MEPKLGEKARDSVTGFTGTATARIQYLNGETQYLLEAVGSDGKPVEMWFRAPRLAVQTGG